MGTGVHVKHGQPHLRHLAQPRYRPPVDRRLQRLQVRRAEERARPRVGRSSRVLTLPEEPPIFEEHPSLPAPEQPVPTSTGPSPRERPGPDEGAGGDGGEIGQASAAARPHTGSVE